MSTVSSARQGLLPFPQTPSTNQLRSDVGLGSRPRPPPGFSTTHGYRHRQASSTAGSRGRYLDWDQDLYLPCSSNPRQFSPRISSPERGGHPSSSFAKQSTSSRSKVRSYPPVSLPCNEVSPAFPIGGLGRPKPAIQVHQSEHAPNAYMTTPLPLVLTQVLPQSLNEPPSLSSSLTSPAPSLPTPPTPHSQRSPASNRRRSAFITPCASVSSFQSDSKSCEADQLRCERYTPSPSPLSHAERQPRPGSHRSSLPSDPPRAFSIRRGLVPLRARPTLAMSMQIHAPTPVLSTQPVTPTVLPNTRPRSRSRPGSTSRPSSPLTSPVPLPQQRPPMARPPSRSERLLRDTLRRAEEQERLLNPTPSLFGLSPPVPNANLPSSVGQMFGPCRLPAAAHGGRRHHRNASFSVQSDSSCDYFEGAALDEDSQEDEDDNEWLRRANSAASSSSGHSHSYYPTRAVSGSKVEGHYYGTPASPSPARAQLQRAAKSSPSVPRRHSHSQSVSNVPVHPPSRTHIDAEPALTPHEAVLRRKLEGVLKTAEVQDRRTRSVERRELGSGFSSGSGNSMASSRNRSGEGDFFFGVNGDSSLTSLTSDDGRHKYSSNSPSSPRSNPRALHMAPHPSPRSTHKPLSSKKGSGSSAGPLTPPPSPPFNARQAAAQCKAMDGYISFATIEGLGVPEGSDEEADEEAKSRSRWFQWLHISGKTAPSDRVRGRGESSSSSSR